MLVRRPAPPGIRPFLEINGQYRVFFFFFKIDAASFGSRSFGLARLEKDVDAAKYTSNIYSSHRKEIVRIHGWLHTSGFSSSPAEARISSKISPRLGGFHHYDHQKGVYIFDFLPLFLLQLL